MIATATIGRRADAQDYLLRVDVETIVACPTTLMR
jgi:hypothetical protein